MIVAVAMQMKGFTTLGELMIPFVFHIVVSVAGLQFLLLAAKRADAEKGLVPSAEAVAE